MSDIDTVHFRGNNRLLHQACSNLIQNAIKYSNPNSMIDVNLFNNEGTIYFTVTNEGHTIPESVQPHLFDRFYKRNAEDNSNGLGLAITQSIIHLHRGQISVTSNDRDGTTFTVTLPETN